MANGFVQGCPVCPGLVNILFEPFHRRAAAQKKRCCFCGRFLEDVTLVAVSLKEVQFLVPGYQALCDFLRIKLNGKNMQL